MSYVSPGSLSHREVILADKKKKIEKKAVFSFQTLQKSFSKIRFNDIR